MEINYVIGDATQPVSENPVIICHIVNNLSRWGKGFVMALSRRYPQPEREYRRWHQGETGIPWDWDRCSLWKSVPDYGWQI